jgi:hypothetical protein
MSDRLMLAPNFEDADRFYADLVRAHDGLSLEASALLNARLVLILANHVGTAAVLAEALDLAKAHLPTSSCDRSRRTT